MKQHLRTLPLFLSLFAGTLLHGQQCFYTLRMFAADGNGWGGSYVTIGTSYQGMVECTDHTLESGDQGEVQIPTNIGHVMTASYTAVGGDQEGILYQLYLFGIGEFHSFSPPTEGIAYASVVDCTPSAAWQTDCIGAHWMNFHASYSWNSLSTGFSGFVSDLDQSNQGCLEDGENHGIWRMLFDNNWPLFTGPYSFSITPHPNHPADYDFALWGPFYELVCPPAGPPIRCSYAANTGSTGLASFAEDDQDEDGDGWASPIHINAGENFLLYVGRKDNGPLNFTYSPSYPTGLAQQATQSPFTLHPNPATDRCTLTLSDVVNGTLFLQLHDAAGRKVMQEQFASVAKGSSFNLELRDLQPGAYLLHLRDAQGMPLGSTRLLKH